jgi:cytoskeleton protein RodZ
MIEGLPQVSMTEASAAGVPVGGLLPGAALRAERENQGLTVDAVVQATRFSVRQVDALERDDYASLPGMTTVRGFVRSYAKYLQLDAATLLDALDSVAPLPIPEVRPPANMGEARPGVSALRRAATYFVAVCVAAILMLTVYGYVMQRAQQPMSLTLNSLKNNQSIQAVPTNSPAASAGAAPVERVALAPLAASGPAVVKEVAAEVGSNPAVAMVPAPSPAPVLSVIFDGASWIEVRDATQKVVLSGEFPAGTAQKIEGKRPFQLWLGNAPVVRVFSGERGIDLQPFTRAGVARLTLE